MLGIKTRYFDLNPQQNFNFSIENIKTNINKKSKAICLVSPNNPTGTVFDSNRLNKLLSLCKKYGLFFILDETYRDFIHPKNDTPHSLFKINDWSNNLIQLYIYGHQL